MTETTEHPQPWAANGPPAGEDLAERLRRLEQTLAALQNPAAMEEQIAARVLVRVQEQTAAAGGTPQGLAAGDATGYGGLVQAAIAGALLPASVLDPTAGFWGRFAVLRELRLMVRMYFDPRYRLSRAAQFGVPAIVVLVVLNYLTFAFAWPVPVIAPVFERVFLAVLAVALYKVLSREAARYAAVLRYLAQFGR